MTVVQFVAAPDIAAAVRLDLNPSDAIYAADVDLGVPQFLGDPDGIGVEYGLRTLRFTQVVRDTKAVALARQSALARELLRPSNWLLFRVTSTSNPVWFKTWRSQPGELSLEQVYDDATNGDLWAISVTIAAEPFAYGALETIGPVTINNNPAHATNPMSYVLPTIKGDAPAPLRVAITPSAAWTDHRPLMNVTPVPSGVSHPQIIFWTGSGFTGGTDTAAQAAAAAYPGGGYRAVSFATVPAMATRLSGNAPSTPPPGRYKVFAYVGRSDTSSTFAMRFGQNYGLAETAWGDTYNFDRAASPAADHKTWVELGVFSFPRGADLDEPATTGATVSLSFQMQRLSGTGAARVAGFALVPVGMAGAPSSRTLRASFLGVGLETFRYGMWDGDREVFETYDFGVLSGAAQPIQNGDYMQVVPGYSNVFHLLQQTMTGNAFFTATSNADVITNTASVTLTYHPRHLYLGAA